MRDYRVPKAVGGFNPQKLYTEILKSDTEDRWYMQKHNDKTLITNYGAYKGELIAMILGINVSK